MTIREAAERATPGPWRYGYPRFTCKLQHSGPHHPGPPECRYTFDGWEDGCGRSVYRDQEPSSSDDDSSLIAGQWDYDIGGIRHDVDAAYIAAADPTTVLALLAERDRLQRERDDAVEWIRVVGEAMAGAGYKAGDRTVTLANVRAMLALVTKLREALQRLTNEVRGITSLAESAMRESAGNTNYAVLMLRADEADACLAAEEPRT
jgi:hypothetical protein